MKSVFLLLHKHVLEYDLETGEAICDTKLLGGFSSKEKCEDVIPYYLKQPGFKDWPDEFEIEEVYADMDEFSDVVGEFTDTVFYLSHEWYDGEYDYITQLGFYSSFQKAKNAESAFKKDSCFAEHPDGFEIGEIIIDKTGWTEGFVDWDDIRFETK